MKHPGSMRYKLHLRLFLMGVLGLVLSAAVCIAVLHRAYSRQMWNTLEQTVYTIAERYEETSDTEPAALLHNAGLRLTLVQPDGTVVYDTSAVNSDNHLTRPEIQQALEHGTGKDERQSKTVGYHTYYYAIRLDDGNVLRAAQEAESIRAMYYEAIPAIAVFCVLFLLLSGALSWWQTDTLVQPIIQMSANLNTIQENNPYNELTPMALAIHSDRILRENNDKLRQEFTANVSHELKTPLTSISGYAELISSGLAQPEDVPGFANRIHSEAARMITLVNDILALSKLDNLQGTTQRAPDFELLDLAQIAKNCAERLHINARNAYVVLHTECDTAMVQGDRQMLAELCQNLCDNAIRYNRPGGRVDLITGKNAWGKPYIMVRDNGLGIPKEAQPHIFERFYRVDKSRSKSTGGTGLGLAIVKHIALLHHADIALESEVNEGTRIVVTFDPVKR